MLTEKQLKRHNESITGSMMPAILNLYPPTWGETRYTLFARKKGLLPPKATTPAMIAGNYAEAMISEYCQGELGWRVDKITEDDGWKSHPDIEFVGGFADRLIDVKGASTYSHVGELKNVGFRMIPAWHDEDGNRAVPDYVQCQAFFYSMLWELPPMVVACLGGNDFQFFDLPRDIDIETYLLDKACEFHYNLECDKWPEPDASPGAMEAIRARFPQNITGKMLEGTAEDMANAIIYDRWKKQYAEADKGKKNIAPLLTNRIGDNDGLQFPDGKSKVTWKKNKDSQRFNEDKFAVDHPKLYKKYLETKPGGRRLLVTIK